MLRVPITPFSVAEFGITPYKFCQALRPVFHTLAPDLYDVKAKQIEILKHSPIPVSAKTLRAYYEGALRENVLEQSYQALPAAAKREYRDIAPYRYRAISTFKIVFGDKGEPQIERCKTAAFTQDEALIAEDKTDVRQWRRVFPELSEEAASLPAFRLVLEGLSKRINTLIPHLIGLNIVTHHVKLTTLPRCVTSNAPEGLHQDGFPLIVSALVVERKNVSGAESQIYGEDKQDPLFTTVLQPGSGLLQPDLHSPLWHTVTPISGKGHRSSIGFDIQPLLKMS